MSLKQILQDLPPRQKPNGNHLFEHKEVAFVNGQINQDEVEEPVETRTLSEIQAAEPGPSRLRDTAIGLQILVSDLYETANALTAKLEPFLVKGEPIRFDHEPAAGLKPHDTIHHEAEQVGNLLVALRALATRIDA